jgi:hypothetical protein
MLGQASQTITQDRAHIDEAMQLAVDRTAAEMERLLMSGRLSLPV